MITDTDTSSAATPTRLSEQINNATRSQHTTLNRLIMSRLPQSLPPHASHPDAYLLGMSQIAELFFAFEYLWDEVTSTSQLSSMHSTWDSLETPEDPLLPALRTLRPMGIARSSRLKNDLEYLRCVCGLPEDDAQCVVAEGIKAHIETEVRQSPHLLIAYAWTLYLAVFSGGRHIRNILCEAGEDFWLGRGSTSTTAEATQVTVPKKSSWNWRSPVARLTSSASKPEASMPKSRKPKTADDLSTFEAKGLSFWFFPGAHDGEELRAEFKQRLHDLEPLLSVEQELEIVAEAQAIFSRVEALVSELDAAVSPGQAITSSNVTHGRREQGAAPPEPVAVEYSSTTETYSKAATELLPISNAHINEQNQRRFETSSYAGLALVVCGISYCAAVYGGPWFP